MRALAVSVALLFPSVSWGFCGVYLGSTGDQMVNKSSQVVLVRQGTTTHVTLVNNYTGPLDEFAIVVPVPELLGPDDVQTVDPVHVEALQQYSAPRQVTYDCPVPHTGWVWDTAFDTDTADTADTADTGSGVTVLAEYEVGIYNMVILSATESAGLMTWLNTNGYVVPVTAETALQEYITADMLFMAAQVSLSSTSSAGHETLLEPLRLEYESTDFMLPIRLGTASSDGEQDLVIYGISDASDGSVVISNYPEFEVEDDCMWDPAAHASFTAFYEQQYAAGLASQPGAGWSTEYSWTPAGCDPCTGVYPGASDFDAVGYVGHWTGAWLQRLRHRSDRGVLGGQLG